MRSPWTPDATRPSSSEPVQASGIVCGTILGPKRARLCFPSNGYARLPCPRGGVHEAMANSIIVIFPYRHGGTWVFDDPAVGLLREPFVAGIPEMIDRLVEQIPHAASGFKLLFSSGPFPGYQVRVEHVREEHGGNWYRWPGENREGWLCPALFKYFDKAPAALYCRAEPLESSK